MDIYYINRETKKREKELVYGGTALSFLYSYAGFIARYLLSKFSFFSQFYGYLQRRPSSKKKILPFIKKFNIDTSEFLEPVASYPHFDAFFTRKIKQRPLAAEMIIPADGRYLFYPSVREADGFVIKGKKFCLEQLIDDHALFTLFHEGAMCIARLCPSDYHRFHFPCDGVAHETYLINGGLFSVNPIALRKNLNILVENKRTRCLIESKEYGRILYMEVGATNVGTIHQTYTPNSFVKKGDEKGYFSFGGSTLVLLFENKRIRFDEDLCRMDHSEILCKMGQSMARQM